MNPEFSHRVAINEIGATRLVELSADGGQRAALAKRLGIERVDALSASIELSPRAAGVEARGSISAHVTQRCVATGEPVERTIDEPFDILFVAPDQVSGDEIELSSEECDRIEHDGLAIDLGEAAAQTLALALDPYPRAPGADAALADAGVLKEGEETVGPFAALKGLK